MCFWSIVLNTQYVFGSGSSCYFYHNISPFLANDLVCCGVLSGNRNFEGRIHPNTRANYLASPLLVIAYAIAGTVNIDFEIEPLGTRADGSLVFLRDIWPSHKEITQVEQKYVIPAVFQEVGICLLFAFNTERFLFFNL